MNISKTQDEIVTRIKESKAYDVFGTTAGDLIGYLDFDHAREFLKPDCTREMWEEHPHLTETTEALEEIKAYMPFAINKAKNGRGLSALRSMIHFSNWIWIVGDEGHFPDLFNYTDYGLPHLKLICERYGLDWKEMEDESEKV